MAQPRHLLQDYDFPLLLGVLTIATLGVVNLYSASQATMPTLYQTQLGWLGLGMSIAVLLSFIDYRNFEELAYPLFGVTLALLLAVLIMGKVGGGSQRWLVLGPIRMQPSELVKLTLVFALARWFSKHDANAARGDGHALRDLLIPMGILALPVVLIIPQPDLGTSVMVMLVGISMMLFMKIRWTTLALLATTGAAVAGSAWYWLLRDYQKRRVLTFLNPEGDTLGAGYHAYQSMIAVGSGGLYGKGYMEGTQTQLSFLPEQHTDFVFSVLAEEWGFVGGAGLLFLYAVLMIMALNVSASCRDKFGALLGVGVTALIFWHVVINIGMVVGVLPVVGVPLPLMSYGGSASIVTLLGIGVLLSVSRRRNQFT